MPCAWQVCLLLSIASFARADGRVCDVRAMGAKGDGHTKDTTPIQEAIDTCATPPGGTVHFAPGTYLSAPLNLKSHVHLQLDAAATLLGSPDVSDYPVREDAKWRRISLLHADHATDIAVVGEGTVDGNGRGWWERQEANRSAGVRETPRPMLFDLTHSSKILIEGITIQNSPQYNVMTVLCDGLTVRNVKILNPGRDAPNTDGIDPISTSHVLIEHTLIDTGDDDIAIKSGLVARGDPNVPSAHITIRDCDFRNGHGLSIGSELAGGVRDVRVERVTFEGTRQGLRIKSARGRGNDVANATFRDITMTDVETPIEITMYYTGGMAGITAHPMAEHTPRFRNFTIENLTATGAKHAAEIDGLPESPLKNLVLHHVHLSGKRGAYFQYAQVTATDFIVNVSTGQPINKGPGVDLELK